MRELTDSERDYLIAYWFTEPLNNSIAIPERFKEGFVSGLEFAQSRIDKLEGLIKQFIEIGPGVSWEVDYHGNIDMGDKLDQLIADCQEALK